MLVKIGAIDEDGYGVGALGKKRILIPYTLPGETVEIRKIKKKKETFIALDFTIVEPSPQRRSPTCKYFGKCGGCALQHVPYELQLEIKAKKIEKATGHPVEILTTSKIYGYRNRIDLVTSTQGIGFRVKGFWWKVIDIESCPIFGEKSKRAIETLKRFVREENLSLYNIRKNEGFLRYMVIREGKFTGETMVTLVTSTKGNIPDSLPNYFNWVDSLNWSINPTKSDVSWGSIKKTWGKEYIREKILDVEYLIHPNSFFQTNSYALPLLLRTVEEYIEGEKILDMYCGVGTFGIYLAKKGMKVTGFDSNEFAIEMARMNSNLNNVKVEFKVETDREVKVDGYDTVIVDPPRAGLHPKFLSRLIKSRPAVIIYVSCNPETLKRDLKKLKKIYDVENTRAIDMFPHTPHVETVVKLLKR